MLGSSTCACGAPWQRVDMRDGLGPVWMVRHVGGRDQCRGLPPPKPSELLAGRTPVRWNPSVGTTYAHDCGGELLVSDILGTGQLELVCDCGLSPLELAVQLRIPVARLHPIDLDVSRTMITERGEENPDALAVLALLDAQPLRKARG